MRDLSRQIASSCRKTNIPLPYPPVVKLAGGIGNTFKDERAKRASRVSPEEPSGPEEQSDEGEGKPTPVGVVASRRDPSGAVSWRRSSSSTRFRGRGASMSRKRSNLRRVKIRAAVILTTLAGSTLLSGAWSTGSVNPYRAISIKGNFDMVGHTVGEGPLIFGVALGDYSDAEIEQCIEAQGGIDVADLVTQEAANRFVRQLGSFSGGEVAGEYNDGRPVKARLNWAVPIGQNLKLWVYNEDAGALTTGTIISFTGDMWVKD